MSRLLFFVSVCVWVTLVAYGDADAVYAGDAVGAHVDGVHEAPESFSVCVASGELGIYLVVSDIGKKMKPCGSDEPMEEGEKRGGVEEHCRGVLKAKIDDKCPFCGGLVEGVGCFDPGAGIGEYTEPSFSAYGVGASGFVRANNVTGGEVLEAIQADGAAVDHVEGFGFGEHGVFGGGGGHLGECPREPRKAGGASYDVWGWPPPLSPCRGRVENNTRCKGLVFSAWGKNSETWLCTSETLTPCVILKSASAREGCGEAALIRARRDATAFTPYRYRLGVCVRPQGRGLYDHLAAQAPVFFGFLQGCLGQSSARSVPQGGRGLL